MENNVKPWGKPWFSNPYRNGLTGHQYTGINPLLCGIDSLVYGYTDPRFVTFTQCQEFKWLIKKGSKATAIKWGGTVAKKEVNEETKEETTRFYSALKFFNVFNIECIDDSQSATKIKELPQQPIINTEPRINELEDFIKMQGVKTQYNLGGAFYVPQLDVIAMPGYQDFKDAVSYYSTHVHELAHSTGHELRLKRDLSGKFGTASYAFEELVAELASIFVCNNYNLEYDDTNHASYLKHWFNLLKNDNKAFFKAAGLAQRSTTYMMEKADQYTS